MGSPYRLAGIAIVLCTFLASCSQVPISVDTSTYLTFKNRVDDQLKSESHPLVGMYRAVFLAQSLINRPEDGKPVNGDWKFAAVKRGADIDFISLSGYKGFGGGSDQGGSYSVNFQGATFWSVPYEKSDKGQKEFQGSYSGITGAKFKGNSNVKILDDDWVMIQTTYNQKNAAGEAITDTFFLRRSRE